MVRVQYVLDFKFHIFQVRMVMFLLECVAVNMLYYWELGLCYISLSLRPGSVSDDLALVQARRSCGCVLGQ